ncbi:DUF748 domain-containing protein [Pelagibius sp. 7325]|uniref:DUF748 domain-containing protein n=1 Tax=Pelagibius sp. 7325 TaxID=3131994 RepID=UPI0030EBEE25
MTDKSDKTDTATGRSKPASAASSPHARRRRLAIRAGIGTGIAVVLFVLVVFVLPTPLARYVIESQLEELGIQHDGIDTVDIDLWNSEVRAGPVTFHAGEAQQGQLGETGFDYSFKQLFEGRAFVRTFFLKGVDLYITRLEDGAIEINGINLRDLAAANGEEEETISAEREEETEGGSDFGFGGDNFEFSDSRLVFEDLSGGTLTIDLQRMTLERLRSWTPDEPTTFALQGRLNDIDLTLDGTIIPLGDPLVATLSTRAEGITLDRIARFIGPTGLARQNGTVVTEVRYDYSIFGDGRLEGTVDGTYHLKDFDIATETGETVTLDDATLKVDLRQQLQPDSSATATGQFRLTGGKLTFATATGDALEIGAVDLAVDSLDFEKGAQLRQGTTSETRQEAAPGGGPASSIVQLLIGWARQLGEDALRHHLSADGEPTLTLKDGLLRVAARDGVPGQELSFDQVSVHLGEVASQALDTGWVANGSLDTVISGLRLAVENGRAEMNLAEFRANSRAIDFDLTPEETALNFDFAVALQGLAAKDDQGTALDLDSFSLTTDRFRIGETPSDEEAGGPLTVGLKGLAATLPGDAGAVTLTGDSLALDLPTFTLTGKQGEAARVAGSLELTGLSVDRGGNAPLSFSLASTRSDLQDVRVAPLNKQATVEGGLATQLSGVTLSAGAAPEAFSLSIDSLENELAGLKASGFDTAAPGVTLATETRLAGLAARLPLPGGEMAEASVATLQAPLTELAFADGAVRAEGAVEVTGIAAHTGGETPQSVDLAGLSITGLSGNSAEGAAVEQIALGELTAKLALPLPGMAESATASSETTAAQTDSAQAATAPDDAAPAGFDMQFKLGTLTLAAGSTIEITDRSVEPPLQANIMLEELKAGPFDTAAPETRTDIVLALAVNETSKVQLQGWGAPLKTKPDFELSSQIDGLLLAILSPYAAKMTGVNIESGELTAAIDANAAEGDLGGAIDLRIDDLFVTPISEQTAEEIKADIGLPVGFAVSILKDDKGVIAFGLPLSGTVAEPQVDYSEAISKAISGAMASVFPTNWFGSDGNTFEMQPAPFIPGTAELTEDGKSVADQMGGLFASKPGISIRTCGRAGRADLVALRGDPLEEPLPAPDSGAASEDAAAALAPPDKGIAPAPESQPIAKPSDAEVEALLALATERGAAVRKYLQAKYGIDPSQIPECRTAYSIEDNKLPRAEFQF